MADLSVGQDAPDFTLKDENNQNVTLSELRGTPVVLVFYPLDFSPMCTHEMCTIRDDYSGFQEKGAKVFGISRDSVWTHKAFKDPKYRHFIRIPRRIIRCLELLGVSGEKVAVERRLRAYYLFIGVVDNAIDSGHPNANQSVLRQLETLAEPSDESTSTSEIALATEGLKLEISGETSAELLGILRALSKAVELERTVVSMTDYIEVRMRVGRLTARASYVLIRPFLGAGNIRVCRFMEQVGEIGCLIDSVIDLRADQRSGLLNFQSTRREFMRLLSCTVNSGAQFSIRHPRFFGLFLEAAIDTLRDRPRARAKRRLIPTKSAATTTT